MTATPKEMVLEQLNHQREKINELDHSPEVKRQLKEHRRMRDSLLIEGVEMGITEHELCRAAGITRGWLWRMKLRRQAHTL